MLRVGDTLDPFLFSFDGTQLSNLVGNYKQWPVYMTIGNQSSNIWQTPSTHSVVMVALLPIPINNSNTPQKRLDEQRQRIREVLNEVLRRLPQPLAFKQNPSAWTGLYNVLCADGNFSCCKLVLAAWLADCAECSDLHHLEQHVCSWGECPNNELGDNVHPDKQHPRRDHNLYKMLRDSNTKSADAELSSRHVPSGFIVFGHIRCIVSELPKPDLLYTMQIGMLDHHQKWIFHCMNTYEWLNTYNAIC